ncbi:Transcription-repair-coupling factor [Aquisphaera giovannonii]|uniref:Transcription-repair-coupling factor n=1 Tax=Aquisphaera giovannonii TaxID=406548 RepID=A0A5B9WES3_9BACT|nr:DEAD/DEAH box helicase [Aquisphaera giovannonii]QEH38973.1 Transcription-repair-coupling factor [Aquisphaera giovannonii]
MSLEIPSRDELYVRYVDQLPYEPYPVQDAALAAWFESEQGVLVCAPTGTGKTLIAEAALFEALHTGKSAYYTTPLIALTEQKFQEMQDRAEEWGFRREDVGLVTGSRKVNPDAPVLIVVAEILLNRLLNRFDFSGVTACVMDEFHNFAEIDRGIVWELSLGMLPKHVRLLLLSATVGNAGEFVGWLARHHDRRIVVVEGNERRVPLTYEWVPDKFLNEQLVVMAAGDEEGPRTPALVFCFDREECWSVAENVMGKDLNLSDERKKELHDRVNAMDFSQGAGPKLKRLLHRGVGVHHAGLLPKYRLAVEDLFQRKLLPVVVCTETLAAGINLPARSVVLSSLVKGPFGAKKLIGSSIAHQIFGRAGRPQFDDRGYVYALAHPDDVDILRWKAKYDAIPEDTRDPGLMKAKKALKKKRPKRRETEQYWVEGHFNQLKAAPPGKLYSKGPLPWRLLAYLLEVSPEVEGIRAAIRKRLMDDPRIAAGEKALDRMLLALRAGGFVTLTPEPPAPPTTPPDAAQPPTPWTPILAQPTPALGKLLAFRSIHPLYGAFLTEMLAGADADERMQAMESTLEMPGPVRKRLRVPLRLLEAGALATSRLDAELIQRGLMAAKVEEDEEEEDEDDWRNRPPAFAEKLRSYFDHCYPDVTDVQSHPIWCVGELIEYGGNFNKFVTTHDLTKQEGIVFRHVQRMIMLCGEFERAIALDVHTDPDAGSSALAWRAELHELAAKLTESCRVVDPTSTDQLIARIAEPDVIDAEAAKLAGGAT